MDDTAHPHFPTHEPVGRAHGALAGLAAGAAAIGSGELVAGLVDPWPSLILGVGDTIIDFVPGSTSRAAIETFGTADKPALIVGTLIAIAIFAGAVGMVARRHFGIAMAAFVGFATCGVVATATQPTNTWLNATIVGVIAATVGIAALYMLLQSPVQPRLTTRYPAQADRRSFLISATGTLVIGAAVGVTGWVLSGRERVDEIRRTIALPKPFRRAKPIPAAASLDVNGITPLFVPNSQFYRIDTALRPPTIDPQQWQLKIHGMVERPYTLSYDELLAMEQIEADITLACVSNEVGGSLVGNARWQGVPLQTLLQRAQPQATGVQVVGHSVDGFTAGFPADLALHSDQAMVALAMNGEILPVKHGFPARIIVPGLYGYVSATKWLSAIELTDWDTQGYWIPRGWSQKGPIKTQTRIDVPRYASTVQHGITAIAGVAWAPTRGISKVQVRIDDGPWHDATLAASIGTNSWRQWVYRWETTPGDHIITARATDGTGATQSARRQAVAPNGATGYPTVPVSVEKQH